MTREDRMEAVSLACIHAVAAVCGMTYSVPSKDYGIDLTLFEVDFRDDRFVETGVSLGIQAKSTTTASITDTSVIYDLDIRAYNALRLETAVHRILVVMVLPKDEARWLRQSEAKFEIRKSPYWLSLRGRPAVANRSSIRVEIPRQQLFTADALRRIIDTVKTNRRLS